MKLIHFVKTFVREEDGAAAIEYGLIAALIAVAIILGATALGQNINALFTALANCMTNLPAACNLGG
jgi:pilus assembly protein Flp/PilA